MDLNDRDTVNAFGKAVTSFSTDKRAAYSNLVRDRKACHACQGLINPADHIYHKYDSDQIGPWSLWQGNLDSYLLVVGQDWGDTEYFKKWRGKDQRTGNPTNENLQLLLRQIGIHIGKPGDLQESKSELFFTNLILCLKQGGLQAPVNNHWLIDCGERFFRPFVDLMRPKAILALGKDVATTILELYNVGFNKNHTLKAIMKKSPYTLTPSTVLFPLYHCGAGSVNRNRSRVEQKKDWEKVADWMKNNSLL